MSQVIRISECEKFHPYQWVKLYGIISGRWHYINTCQVYQLKMVTATIRRGWWDDYLLEPVDEQEQPVSIEEATKRFQHL